MLDVCAVKHGDNSLSVAANRRVTPHKATMRTEIYSCLRLDHPQGLTCKELAKKFGRPMHAISGRIAELKALALVRDSGIRRDRGAVVQAMAVEP
jgi:hypothetical protein